jgi:hypothetical protein
MVYEYEASGDEWQTEGVVFWEREADHRLHTGDLVVFRV